MAYDGPFDDERTCLGCWSYIKKVDDVCPHCGTLRGHGHFSYANITGTLYAIGIFSAIFVPIMLLVILAAMHPGGCFSCS